MKKIEYYEYYIDTEGNVYNNKNHILATSISNSGYKQVTLWKDNKGKSYYIHRLLATYYINNPNNYEQVNHIDGNKLNNALSNLEWCTRQYNTIHAIENKLKTYSNRLNYNEFVELLYKVINGKTFAELTKECPYKVPFLSVKLRKIAVELGIEDKLDASISLQKKLRISNRDELGRIKGRATTIP